MRASHLLPLLCTIPIVASHAQSPFQFRETYLLEHRIETARSGQEYDPNHAERYLALEGPSLTTPFVLNPNDPAIFQNGRWTELLDEVDRYRRMGGLELAEHKYLDMAAGLRKAQGPASNDLALMLDHLGEFYLEIRSFDQAYKSFSEALEVRRAAIAALPPAPPPNPNVPEQGPRFAYRLHLADLESRLGQLDLAKGDLASATQRLNESIAIFDDDRLIRSVGGLYAVYFQSLVLEKQQKFQQAEELWRNEVKLREKLNLGDPYWNAQKEMAAYYGRRGDFRTAAQIAQQVLDDTAGKGLRPELPMPYLDSRPRAFNRQQAPLYKLMSDTAMSEILAIDKWRSDGPDAAAALLKDPADGTSSRILDRGSDAERTQLLAWFERRTFLHMSILLDGNPSQDRINRAYTLLCQTKGRYLSSLSQISRMVESERGNPNTQIPEFAILDQLGKAREKQAHLFLDSALNGKKLNEVEFAANDNIQRVLSTALLSGVEAQSASSYFNIPALIKSIPDNTACIDIVAWNRMDRDPKLPAHREYGAFILRNNQPLRYIRIGAVEPIDADIDAVHAGVLSNRERGFGTVAATQAITPEELQKRLRSLYQKVIVPLDPFLQDTAKLYIVPDGKLTMAPISAFADSSGHYVFESRTIMYLDSWRDLMTALFFGSTPPSTPVIIANPDFNLALHGTLPDPSDAHRPVFKPLPGAEAEAGDVAKTLAVPQDHVLTEKAARKWLIQSLQSPEILHFATHSVPHLDWRPPATPYTMFEFPQPLATQYPLLQSVIALAGANHSQQGPEDGLLTGLEVSSLHLDGTRLVVLSSCESGQGAVVDGQGVLGLRAAFSMAGTQSMVMTLWPVDDEAGRQFMHFFYAHLDKGAAEAVRLAQHDMLSTTQYKNPFYWSGYVASGSPVRELMQAPRTQPAAAVAAASPAPAPPAPESFVAPNCFEFFTKASMGAGPAGSGFQAYSDIRLKIGGVTHRSQPTPQEAVYDLTPLGNELDVKESTGINGGPPTINPEVAVASERHWAVDLIVDKQPDKSSVSIRFGPAKADPSQRRLIRLTGPPALFKSLDLPDALPPLSAYTQATYTYGTAIIDRIANCTSAP